MNEKVGSLTLPGPVMKEMFTKMRREIEPKWVAEYCSKFYGKYAVRYRCPLGPVPKELVELHGLEKALRMYRPWRPEVDALVIAKDKLILIEAKVRKVMDGLSKLPIYKMLVPQTPELKVYHGWPIEMELLVVKAVEPWITVAKNMGIRLVEWAPTWVWEIWRQRDLYWTKEAVELRERRKEVLKRLGFI